MRNLPDQTNRRMSGFFWVVASVALQSTAAVLGKEAGNCSAGRDMVSILVNPWVAGVFAALGLQAVCWTLALRRLPLSLAYPCMAVVLPLNLLCSWAIFGERLHPAHLLGCGLMCAGIWLLGRESNSAGAAT
jgi:drug/metabolite transporter (DMT)-like permease